MHSDRSFPRLDAHSNPVPHRMEPVQDLDSDWVTFGAELASGVLVVSVDTDNGKDELRFTVPDGYEFDGNGLAAGLACLCGTNYDKVHFDFPVSLQSVDILSTALKATATASADCPPPAPAPGIALGFSGGLDSLGTKHLIAHENPLLIGIDFGGWFDRETDFLLQYKIDYLASVDYRRKHYYTQSWAFMGVPLLMFANHFGYTYAGFGTTIESAEWSFRGRKRPNYPHQFRAAGVELGTVTNGCSEFLAAYLVLKNEPEAITKSLVSLAGAGSEKMFRKALAVRIAEADLAGTEIDTSDLPLPTKPFEFGSALFVDFAFVVIAARGCLDILSQYMTFPDELIRELPNLNTDWLFKYHPVGMPAHEPELSAIVAKGLELNGIEVFNDKDLENYNHMVAVVDKARKLAAN